MGMPSLAIMTIGCATAVRAASSGMEWITTIPPFLRYFSNVSAVKRSPVSVHCKSWKLVSTQCYPYTAGGTYVQAAVFDCGWHQMVAIRIYDLPRPDTGLSRA